MYKSYCGKYSTNYLEELVKIKNLKEFRYSDPDDGYKIKDNEYYTNIVRFLNKREEYVLNGEWKYDVKDKGIEVKEGVQHKFYLRSDQFGFSAPRINGKTITACSDKYPYWCYLEKSNNNNKANDVVNWITNTRTIGGSFIWPVWKKDGVKNLYSYYNVGDKKNKLEGRGVGSYIEDSVDLTLYEVMLYYDSYNMMNANDKTVKDHPFKDTVLFATEFKDNEHVLCKCPMKIWLDHFRNFETYVKFFMFDDDFVKSDFKMSEELMKLIEDCFVENEVQEELDYYSFCKNNVPKNLLDGSDLNDDLVEGYKNDFKDKKRRIANNEREPEELEKILNRLSDMTLMRTARMLEVINNSESSKS